MIKVKETVKAFSNRSNAKRAMIAFREANEGLTDVGLSVVNVDGGCSISATLPKDASDDVRSIVERSGFQIVHETADAQIEDRPTKPAKVVSAKAEKALEKEALRLAEVEMRKEARAERKAAAAESLAEVKRIKAEVAAERKAKREAAKAEKPARVAKPKAASKPKANGKAKAAPKREPSEGKPSGKVAEILRLASRKNGVTPQELNDFTTWKGAPWKWLFKNPKGNGYCDRWGFDFKVVKEEGKSVRYHVEKRA